MGVIRDADLGVPWRSAEASERLLPRSGQRLFRQPSKWVDERPVTSLFDIPRKMVTMDSTQAVHALGALAHETRLAIYRMLVEQGPDGLPAGIIAERLGLPPSSLTFHVQHLHRAGLLTQRRVSRQLIYAADFSNMNGLVGFLTENCCGQGLVACLPQAPAPASCTPRKAAS
jgi:DNA-binding transcriptional ArsR family regulator